MINVIVLNQEVAHETYGVPESEDYTCYFNVPDAHVFNIACLLLLYIVSDGTRYRQTGIPCICPL